MAGTVPGTPVDRHARLPVQNGHRYPPSVLTISNLHKSFGGPRQKVLVDDLSFDLPRGDFVAVMGESGTGKSTLLNMIAGLERPDSGRILVDDTEVTALDERALALFRRRHVGFVFQAFHVLPYLTVAQNVALPLELNDWTRVDADARVGEMLDAVGLADRAGAAPRELSGGELQRVALARALAHRPSLVLADEPTGNLDPETADQVLALVLSEVKRNGASAILVTHSLRAARIADRAYGLARRGLQLLDVTTGA
jgi:putative ABC transport system ATP-binding protein